MKKFITLTTTFTAAVLLLVVINASAANTSSDGNEKCKKHCCKKQQGTTVTTDETVKELKEAIKTLVAELKTINTAELAQQVSKVMPVRIISNGNGIIIIDQEEESKEAQKINFRNIDKEMDMVQEDLGQMDPTLKKDDTQTRKAGEEILKTGIKI